MLRVPLEMMECLVRQEDLDHRDHLEKTAFPVYQDRRVNQHIWCFDQDHQDIRVRRVKLASQACLDKLDYLGNPDHLVCQDCPEYQDQRANRVFLG